MDVLPVHAILPLLKVLLFCDAVGCAVNQKEEDKAAQSFPSIFSYI